MSRREPLAEEIVVGTRCGRLVVTAVGSSKSLGIVEIIGLGLLVRARCDCAHEVYLTLDRFRSGQRRSCGCGKSQNGGSRKVRKPTTSKFKGVYFHALWKKWIARVQVDGRKESLGGFYDEISAARAYDAALVKLHGDSALTNERMGLFRKTKTPPTLMADGASS